jgi:flagellin-like protein
MRIWKNVKALSPVVASIILIAVTVAVSIAVGVWMFGLSGSFMGGAEQLKITNVVFGKNTTTTSQDHFNITLANSGTASVTVNEIWVGNTKYYGIPTNPAVSVPANNQTTVTVTFTWVAGSSYEVKVVSSRGNTVSYPTTAPYV